MPVLLLLLLSLGLFGQAQTPWKVNQSAGSATGAVWLQERRTNGTDWLKLLAPQSMAGDVTFVLPNADGSAGYAMVTDGSGNLSFASVAGGTGVAVCSSTTGNDSYSCTTTVGYVSYSAGMCVMLDADVPNTGPATLDVDGIGVQNIYKYNSSALSNNDILATAPILVCHNGTDFILQPGVGSSGTAWVNGGNSFGADGTLGTNDAYSIIFKTDNTNRWKIDSIGNISAITDGANDIGAIASGRPSNVYITGAYTGDSLDVAPAGGVGNPANVRKLNIMDQSGFLGFWDIQTDVTLTTSDIHIRDNGGSPVLYIYRQVAGSPVDEADLYVDWLPNANNSQKLGKSGRNWSAIYVSDINTSGGSVYGHLTPAVTNTYRIGETYLRWAQGNFVLGDFSGLITATGGMTLTGTLTIPTGAVNGYVLMTNGSGVATWQPASCPTCFIQNGNSFAANAILGTNDAYNLSFETSGNTRMTINATTGNVTMGADGTQDIGAISSGRPSNVYITGTYTGANGDFAPSGGSGNYVSTRKLQIVDAAGGSSFAYIDGYTNIGNQYYDFKDSGGTPMLSLSRVFLSATTNTATFDMSVLPRADITYTLGNASFRWDSLSVRQIGATSQRPLIYGGGLDILSFTMSSGVTVGYCLVATSISGSGTWQPCGGISGLTAGRIPYSSSSTILTDTANLAWNNTTQQMTVAGIAASSTITVTGGYITSAQGFISTGTATNTVNIASGGITGKYLIATTSLTEVGDTAANAGLSSPGQGRIYFDVASNKFRVSENGAAYTDLLGGSVTGLTSGRVPYAISSTSLADTANFTWTNASRVLTITGNTGTAGIVAATSYIQSAEGFYTTSTAATAVNVPSGGVWTLVFSQPGTTSATAGSSTAGNGRIYFDTALGVFRVSENGGSYQNLVSSLPVVDTTAVVKGSVDATKLLRFEVDGFTAATTRVLTPQNASYTIAGLETAQTFTSAQTFNSTLNAVSGLTINGTLVIASSRDMSNITSVQQNWVPTFNATYDLGSTSFRWNKLWAASGDISGALTVGGNLGLSGNMTFSGTASPIFDGLGSIGTSGTSYGSMYAYTIGAKSAFTMNGTTVIDSSRNFSGVSGTFSSSVTANGGLSTASGSNSTIYIGFGNFYNRTFTGGGSPSCLGVTDGWMGFNTTTNTMYVCSGGVARSATFI